MKLSFIPAAVALLLTITSCGGKKEQEPVQKMIPASNVQLSGSDAGIIEISGEVKIFMVQSPDNEEEWTICALVPMAIKNPVSGLESIYKVNLDILDENYCQIHNRFAEMVLQKEDIAKSLFTSCSGTQNNLVFEPRYSSISYLDYDKIVELVNKSENISLTLQLNDPYRADSYEEETSSNSSSSAVQSVYDEVADEYSRALKEAEREVQNAYEDAEREVRSAMRDAMNDLF